MDQRITALKETAARGFTDALGMPPDVYTSPDVLAAEQQRVIAMVENLHRYSPAFRQAKFLLDNGFLGQLHTVNGHVEPEFC